MLHSLLFPGNANSLFPKRISFLLLFTLSTYFLTAQDSPVDTTQQAVVVQKVLTMQSILESIASLQVELQEKEREYKKVKTEEGKNIITEEIQLINDRLSNLDRDFAILSAGIEADGFFADEEQELNWETEVKDVFSPLLYELKEITALPREIERLKASIPYFERRIDRISLALANLDTLSSSVENPQIKQRLVELVEFWSSHQQEHQSELKTMQLQLVKLEKEKKSFGEATGEVMRNFFKSRSKNLLLAFFIFGLTFFVLRYGYKLLRKYIKVQHRGERQFFLRLIDLFYYLFTLVASIGLFLSVLYLASDWILLALSILVLLGLIWAGKNALPSFFEQAKLLLNLGAVREGERLMYQGVPWLVESLNFYTRLVNPELEGGYIRLPIKDLIGLRSRPFSEVEPWFPTSKGDWIRLSDGFYGKVFIQTPEMVGIDTQRGSFKNYSIKDFLSNRPQNLSRNYFSVNRTIEIDFKYRDQVNEKIAPAIREFFLEAIKKEPYGHFLIQAIVELKEVNTSSLGIICILKFKGDTASEYYEIGWKIEQIALEALNHLNLEIPYPHLVIKGKEEFEEVMD